LRIDDYRGIEFSETRFDSRHIIVESIEPGCHAFQMGLRVGDLLQRVFCGHKVLWDEHSLQLTTSLVEDDRMIKDRIAQHEQCLAEHRHSQEAIILLFRRPTADGRARYMLSLEPDESAIEEELNSDSTNSDVDDGEGWTHLVEHDKIGLHVPNTMATHPNTRLGNSVGGL